MSAFHYQKNILFAENVSLLDIVEQFGTPCYVYSRLALETRWQMFAKAFAPIPHQICYAVKANANVAILNLLARVGSGFDIVSGGELQRVLVAQGEPKKIVFSGIGKNTTEILHGIAVGVGCFNIESVAEMEHIQHLAASADKKIPIAIRINPNIDAKTHPYIATGLKDNKFGIPVAEAIQLYREMPARFPHLDPIGIACHIGSQLTELSPFIAALDCLLEVIQQLAAEGIPLREINMGGGLGITYADETPPPIEQYARVIIDRVAGKNLSLILEPGRTLIGDAGVLITRVQYLKQTPDKHFAIVDAGMNDLIRPALYGAWHNVLPVHTSDQQATQRYDIVGPVCESADFFGKDRLLNLHKNDLLAITQAGAYSFSMSSNYNARPRPPEILIDNDRMHLIRRREVVADMLAMEQLLPTA